MNKDLMIGAWRSLVARVLWEHPFLQARLIAITDFLTFITNYIVTESDKLLLERVLLKLRKSKFRIYTFKKRLNFSFYQLEEVQIN